MTRRAVTLAATAVREPRCVAIELVLVFGAPLSPGTTLSATCELSADKRRDCPRL